MTEERRQKTVDRRPKKVKEHFSIPDLPSTIPGQFFAFGLFNLVAIICRIHI